MRCDIVGQKERIFGKKERTHSHSERELAGASHPQKILPGLAFTERYS